jgi:hypothetical protein
MLTTHESRSNKTTTWRLMRRFRLSGLFRKSRSRSGEPTLSQLPRSCCFSCGWLLFVVLSLMAARADDAPGEPLPSSPGGPAERPTVLVVVGAGGTEEYEATFTQWSETWREAAEQGDAEFHRIGVDGDPAIRGSSDSKNLEASNRDMDDSRDNGDDSDSGNENDVGDHGRGDEGTDRALLLDKVAELAGRESLEPLWIVLLGHGTYDGKTAKFNLRGPDISAEDLAASLAEANRPQVIINCSSSSGPFVNVLSAPQRVVVTATRSGHELNYSRFGGYFAEAIANPAADLDKDDQVSVLEAFLYASGKVAQFYADENRLATEHAILDDNGDGLGTPADFFRGVRAVRGARDGASPDGRRARQIHLVRSSSEQALSGRQRQRRDELEQRLETLRDLEAGRSPEDHYQELEEILVEIARIYEEG